MSAADSSLSSERQPERILCVDDEPQVVQGYQRALCRKFTLEVHSNPVEALEMIRKNHYAVVVADMRMPEMEGVELLEHTAKCAPDTVRMMLTGNSDQDTAIRAINDGHIFRFVTKPCPPPEFAKALTACLEQYRLLRSRQDLLSKTLTGSIKLITDLLERSHPESIGRGTRVRPLVRCLCSKLNVQPIWQAEVACMLSQLGFLLLPDEVVTKALNGDPLSPAEQEQFQNHTLDAHNLLANIPYLENIAQIVLYHRKKYNGEGVPDDTVAGEDIPIESRIIRLALDWDDLIASGLANDLAFADLIFRRDEYGPRILEALGEILQVQTTRVVTMAYLEDLADDTMLAEDIITINGLTLCRKGQSVTRGIRLRLRNYKANVGIKEPFRIFVDVDEDESTISNSETSPQDNLEPSQGVTG